MKNIIYLIILSITLVSCNKFIEPKNLQEYDLESFYSTPEQIDLALGGVYNSFFIQPPYINNEPDLIANILSDDMFAGGGSDDVYAKNIEFWQNPTENAYIGAWKTYYQGIFRANVLLDKFDEADYGNNLEARNQALGEAHFMRAFYYFRLSQMFGGLPLMTSYTQNPNQPRASLDDTYALIASDLKKAIEIMPRTPAPDIADARSGHATLWAAQALMARVYLFYTGYSTNTLNNPKNSLPLVDGGSISKTQVQDWLTDLIDNSGHQLNADPRNIWPYTHTSNFGYQYGAAEGLDWAGEGDLEIIFAVKYAPFSGWNPEGRSYVNQLGLYQSIRDNSLVPFGQGWGWCTVSPNLWNAYDANDVRKKGYIINVNEPDEGTDTYQDGKGDHETGFWNKKYTNVQYDAGTGEGVKGMFYNLYGGPDHFMLWFTADQILIRYADVLLMAAELDVNPQANLDAVRQRANAPLIPATIDNIRNERRLELCFEGLRYYDLLRYGTADAVLNAVNVPVKNYGVTTQFIGVYRPETKGLLPIPEGEIRLSGGVLTQNPGW